MSKKFIAGLISPEVLRKAFENDLGMEAMAIKRCDILEIRYDLFKNMDDWQNISRKIFELSPKALRLGTIRLKKDGGSFKNEKAAERNVLFTRILANGHLDWIDLERGMEPLKSGCKVIRSWHLFDRAPSIQELSVFAEECLSLGVQGCKTAAMAHSESDAEPLYDFAKKYGKKFELFSAFAMGEHGKESRFRSLKEGANLAYASIGEALAPGQLSVWEM